ncbi:uncharacterized protein RAG0_02389 [Rhynchosporium agropyri]|uniref:Uncharacterized protein n=1 Tax=Rhynchosporium agropyri TaxID=914238 RepID=A0A1E1K5I9_9HELO|nr:uncharacterized protein RAG0_02389 [Rhynchosporium agropyri]
MGTAQRPRYAKIFGLVRELEMITAAQSKAVNLHGNSMVAVDTSGGKPFLPAANVRTDYIDPSEPFPPSTPTSHVNNWKPKRYVLATLDEICRNLPHSRSPDHFMSSAGDHFALLLMFISIMNCRRCPLRCG